MIDVASTNDTPKVTAQSLLDENPSTDDCRKVEMIMGRFNSTTGFLRALRSVLVDLEANSEAELLGKFIPEMARVEAAAMNGDSDNEPDTVKQPFLSAQPERELPFLRDKVNPPRQYSSVEDGELINAGHSSVLEQMHDYLGSPPSPNGE